MRYAALDVELSAKVKHGGRTAKDSIESNHRDAVAKMVVFPSPTKPCVDTKRYWLGERRVGKRSEPNMRMNSESMHYRARGVTTTVGPTLQRIGV